MSGGFINFGFAVFFLQKSHPEMTNKNIAERGSLLSE